MNINNYIEIAKTKISNKYLKTFILGILSGVFLSFAAIASTVASCMIDNYSISKLLSAMIFPMGLILIILLKTELFTGNSLMIIPVLEKKAKIKEVLRNWIIVYLGNLVGSIIIAILISNTALADKIGLTFINITNTKISFTITKAIVMGILCNFLVCTAVYLATICNNIWEKVVVIFIPIFIFIILSLEHSVANMFYLSIGYVLNSSFSITDLLLKNLLPVTLGNIIGGSLFGLTIWYLREQK